MRSAYRIDHVNEDTKVNLAQKFGIFMYQMITFN